MHWDQVVRNWARVGPRIQERWSGFTDGHLATIWGDRDMLVAQIAVTHGISHLSAAQEVRQWQMSLQEEEISAVTGRAQR